MADPQQIDLDAYFKTSSAVEPHIKAILRGIKDIVIFDIGGCEGEDSVRYAKLFPNGRVFTFEPLPANQALIQKNFDKYKITNATLHKVALSNKKEQASFHVSSGEPESKFMGTDWNYGNKSSSLLAPAVTKEAYKWLKFSEEILVECTTLDIFCQQNALSKIDFVHMDVQGAESLVLEGAEHILPNVLAIWLEISDKELYSGQKLRPEIEAFFFSRGFGLTTQDNRGAEGDQLYVNLNIKQGRQFWRNFHLKSKLFFWRRFHLEQNLRNAAKWVLRRK